MQRALALALALSPVEAACILVAANEPAADLEGGPVRLTDPDYLTAARIVADWSDSGQGVPAWN